MGNLIACVIETLESSEAISSRLIALASRWMCEILLTTTEKTNADRSFRREAKACWQHDVESAIIKCFSLDRSKSSLYGSDADIGGQVASENRRRSSAFTKCAGETRVLPKTPPALAGRHLMRFREPLADGESRGEAVVQAGWDTTVSARGRHEITAPEYWTATVFDPRKQRRETRVTLATAERRWCDEQQ